MEPIRNSSSIYSNLPNYFRTHPEFLTSSFHSNVYRDTKFSFKPIRTPQYLLENLQKSLNYLRTSIELPNFYPKSTHRTLEPLWILSFFMRTSKKLSIKLFPNLFRGPYLLFVSFLNYPFSIQTSIEVLLEI